QAVGWNRTLSPPMDVSSVIRSDGGGRTGGRSIGGRRGRGLGRRRRRRRRGWRRRRSRFLDARRRGRRSGCPLRLVRPVAARRLRTLALASAAELLDRTRALLRHGRALVLGERARVRNLGRGRLA